MARTGPFLALLSVWKVTFMKHEIVEHPGICYLRLTAPLTCFFGAVLLGVSGCGHKGSENAAAESIKGPAKVEQAARILDLSTFPRMDGVKPVPQGGVASLSYSVAASVKTAFEFQRQKLAEQKWKELPNASVTDQSASATFARSGFTVSVLVSPSGTPGSVSVILQNLGNINLAKLPRPPQTRPVYVGEATAMYVTDAPVPTTLEACRKLLLAEGWQPYGTAGDTYYFKQNAIRLRATISAAPAQNGKTMIAYSSELMSADLPALPQADDVRYSDQTRELSFETAEDKNAVVDFYKKTLGQSGWKPTLDRTVEIDDKDTMIFRNAAKDMLTLALTHARDGKITVSLQHQSAAEIAELERRIKAEAPALRAKAQAREAEEEARIAEANKPLPKIAVALPADASGVEQTKDAIKFTVAHGKAKAIAETWRKQFREAGWKEDVATLDAMAGAISLSKERQSLTINYTDTGVMPAEINISAMGAELEMSAGDR
jgi:hypothetical protein